MNERLCDLRTVLHGRNMWAGLLLLLALSACQATAPDPGGGNAGIATIVLAPPSATVDVGRSHAFTATARDSNGDPVDADLSWASSDARVATVASGTATGLAEGVTQITASAGGVTSNGARLNVVAPGGEGAPGTLSGTVSAPPGGDVAGTRVLACFPVGETDCDEERSRNLRIDQSGPNAPFRFEGLESGSYVIVALRDVDGGGLGAGDYYGESALVTPPATDVDVTMEVIGSGGEPPPASSDTIAFVRGDNELRLIDPDGTDDRLVWAAPASDPYELADPEWRPDGTEIAFSSNHELDCSIYERDIYAIRPDGSDLRRVTNAPACADLAGLPTGTVTVSVTNYTNGGPFHVYVQGAPEAQEVVVPLGGTATVTFENVADLGDDLWQQAVVAEGLVRWDAPLAGADVEPGGSVHAGTLHVTSFGIEFFGAMLPSWSNDGATIGYTFGPCAALYRLPSDATASDFAGRRPLLDVERAPGCVLDWGPTPALIDRVLYWNYGDGIYLATAGGDSLGERLLATPAPAFLYELQWLPDGSGFLYTTETDFSTTNIYAYDLASGEVTQLTRFSDELVWGFSVSPDGRRIVFDRKDTPEGVPSLWIMNRDGSDLRLLVEDGAAPTWSR